MRSRLTGIACGLLATLTAAALGQGTAQTANPVIRINVSRSIQTVNYWAHGSTDVDFIGTALLPQAKGKAKVESKGGSLAISAQFEGIQSPANFGPAYLVYVLWAITPEGRTNNLGQLLLKNGKSDLQVTTKLQTFGMIVTAEPYFAVSFPSEEVVLENRVRSNTKGAVTAVDAKFELLERGRYAEGNFQPLPQKANDPLDLLQARNALRIAQWQQADKYAPDSFAKAQQALDQAEDYQRRKQKNSVSTAARNAVQMAEDARAISVKRQEDERIANEQKAAQEREAQAKAAKEAETQKAAAAELAAAQAAQARAEAEAATAKEAQARAAAEASQQAALSREREAQENAAREREAAAQAEQEKQELRAKLLEQFNRVLPTTDTPRGLVVNMGDVLFDTGKADLRPAAREALAKLSGIVLNYPSLQLMIEGHTDSTGTEEFNQMLSEKRADAVRDYLVVQGLPADKIAAQGLGQSMPVADNKTAEGRQKNRRVEIIVSGEVIGNKIGF